MDSGIGDNGVVVGAKRLQKEGTTTDWREYSWESDAGYGVAIECTVDAPAAFSVQWCVYHTLGVSLT